MVSPECKKMRAANKGKGTAGSRRFKKAGPWKVPILLAPDQNLTIKLKLSKTCKPAGQADASMLPLPTQFHSLEATWQPHDSLSAWAPHQSLHAWMPLSGCVPFSKVSPAAICMSGRGIRNCRFVPSSKASKL